MSTENTPPSDLSTRLEKLEARIEEIATQLAKLDRQVVDWDRLNMDRIKLTERAVDLLLDDVISLQLKVFPDLPAAMRQIRKVIGDAGNEDERPGDGRP